MPEIRQILLVEDDPNDVTLTLAAFEESQMANHVDVCVDGEDALDYLHCRGKYTERKPANPVVILLDCKLPKVSGIGVLKVIRSSEKLRTIPVVMVTSSRENRDLATAYELGVNAYVVKPVEFNEFTEALRQVELFWAVLNEPPPK
ncbi:MAG: response regulator [Planctomycetales bacterium]|nr:response regulator [Planctomycetales bacterium]